MTRNDVLHAVTAIAGRHCGHCGAKNCDKRGHRRVLPKRITLDQLDEALRAAERAAPVGGLAVIALAPVAGDALDIEEAGHA